jgi:hypothetical protein
MTWTKVQVRQRREIAGVAISIVAEKKTKTASRLFMRVARHYGLGDANDPKTDPFGSISRSARSST